MAAVGGVLAYLKIRDQKDSLDEDFDDFTDEFEDQDSSRSAHTQRCPKLPDPKRMRMRKSQRKRKLPTKLQKTKRLLRLRKNSVADTPAKAA